MADREKSTIHVDAFFHESTRFTSEKLSTATLLLFHCPARSERNDTEHRILLLYAVWILIAFNTRGDRALRRRL